MERSEHGVRTTGAVADRGRIVDHEDAGTDVDLDAGALERADRSQIARRSEWTDVAGEVDGIGRELASEARQRVLGVCLADHEAAAASSQRSGQIAQRFEQEARARA
jgi:hypothetical protein